MIRSSIPFDQNVDRWRSYSESLKGRVRRELILRHLEKHIGSIQGKMRVLDAGCGLGEIAASLIRKSERIVLLDFSEKMLGEAKGLIAANSSAEEIERLVFVQGPIEALDSQLPDGLFDLVLCHNVLEYIDDPRAALTALVRRLVPGGLLSLVAANRFSDPLNLAIKQFDLHAACLALQKENSTADLFDRVSKRTFALAGIEEMVGELDLNIVGRYGIRVFTDYLPDEVLKKSGVDRLLLDLEQDCSTMPPYLQIARYLHLICRK